MKSIPMISVISLNSALIEINYSDINEVKSIGRDLGLKLLEYYRIYQEIDVEKCLLKVKYLLNKIQKGYRTIEKCIERDNIYIFTDSEPIFGKYSTNICDYVVVGIIEVTLLASGFKCEIEPNFLPTSQYPSQTVYIIKIVDS